MISAELGRLIDELRSSLGALENALNAVPNAIAYTDASGRVRWCNAAFERLARRRRIEIIGEPVKKFPLPKKARRTPIKNDGKRSGTVYVVAPEDIRPRSRRGKK